MVFTTHSLVTCIAVLCIPLKNELLIVIVAFLVLLATNMYIPALKTQLKLKHLPMPVIWSSFIKRWYSLLSVNNWSCSWSKYTSVILWQRSPLVCIILYFIQIRLPYQNYTCYSKVLKVIFSTTQEKHQDTYIYTTSKIYVKL